MKENNWRTLREILEEGHELPLTLENMMTKNKIQLIGPNESGGIVLYNRTENKAYVAVEDPVDIGDRWRIYEPPKEKKKWAPSAAVERGGALILIGRYFTSHEEAKDWEEKNGLKQEVIWPAPGFTPTELPERKPTPDESRLSGER